MLQIRSHIGGKSGTDATRRAVRTHAVLWCTSDDDHLSLLAYGVKRKRMQRLLRLKGLEGVALGPPTSHPHSCHKAYSSLLRDVVVIQPNQVWSTDLIYIPIREGVISSVAIVDWYDHYVLAGSFPRCPTVDPVWPPGRGSGGVGPSPSTLRPGTITSGIALSKPRSSRNSELTYFPSIALFPTRSTTLNTHRIIDRSKPSILARATRPYSFQAHIPGAVTLPRSAAPSPSLPLKAGLISPYYPQSDLLNPA